MGRVKRGLLCALVFAAACSDSFNPCPKGMVREDDHCVPGDPSTTVTAPPDPPQVSVPAPLTTDPEDGEALHPIHDASSATSDGEVVPVDLDGGVQDTGTASDSEPSPMDAPAADAGVDANLSEAGRDDGALSDASITDGADDADPAEAAADASSEAGDAASSDAEVVETCSEQDLATWRAFLASEQLTASIAQCMAGTSSCSGAPCDLPSCLRQAAGFAGCASCALAETQCTAKACLAACRSSDTSDACRACACSHGCIGRGSSCAMGPADICADCSGETCTRVSLDPALIMVVVEAAW